MIKLKKIMILGLFSSIVNSTLFAFTPAPLPAPDACPKDYNPVCGENSYREDVTFANLCKLELSRYNVAYTLKHNGACNQTPTPTPNPLPVELTCDGGIVTTTAQDINITVEHGGDIYNPSLVARTSHPNVPINPNSIRFIDTDGKQQAYKYIEDVGTWSLGINGMLMFQPFSEYNTSGIFTNLEANSTISVDYTINNNCDNSKGISNKATLTVTIIDPSKDLLPYEQPWFDTSVYSCFSQRPIDAINDTVKLKRNEKVKIISILKNDTYLGYPQNTITHFVFASLRLIDENNNLKRRISIKNKGTWLADTTSGEILFVPEPNFIGESTIKYAIHSACTSHYDEYTDYSKARITVIAPTPTPTPTPIPMPDSCPENDDPACGMEDICRTVDNELICEDTIPKQTTYKNSCKLHRDHAIFLYTGKCRKPTPTPIATPKPTTKPTPTATPKPKTVVVTPKEEPKPTTTPAKTVETVETNTTANTANSVTSSDGSALGSLSLMVLIMLTGMIGLLGMRREEV